MTIDENVKQLATEPPENVSREWFAAHTCSCQEKRVTRHLATREIEFFLPLQRKVSRWKNGLRPLIERPLFPGYVFVKIERREKVRILELPGVHSLVGSRRDPIPLPTHEIEQLRQTVPVLDFESHPYLVVGDRARIRRGPLEGFTGIVVRRKNGVRLVLSLDVIMKSISVEIDAQDLASLDSRSPAIAKSPFQKPDAERQAKRILSVDHMDGSLNPS